MNPPAFKEQGHRAVEWFAQFTGFLCLLLASLAPVPAADNVVTSKVDNTPRVLLFSKTPGFRHPSIARGIATIRDLGTAHGFEVEATEDSGAFTSANLARFQAVIFLSVTGDVLNPDQEKAFQDYMENGGGFAGIHGSIFGPKACEDKWTWYGDMFCCAFDNHSHVQPASVITEDPVHPANTNMPRRWERADEWYNYTGTPRGTAHILATVDESTYSGGKMGKDHPIAWCRQVGKGRMWYTAMGHTAQSFSEPLFQQHLLNGIRLAAGWIPGVFTPNNQPAADGSK